MWSLKTAVAKGHAHQGCHHRTFSVKQLCSECGQLPHCAKTINTFQFFHYSEDSVVNNFCILKILLPVGVLLSHSELPCQGMHCQTHLERQQHYFDAKWCWRMNISFVRERRVLPFNWRQLQPSDQGDTESSVMSEVEESVKWRKYLLITFLYRST